MVQVPFKVKCFMWHACKGVLLIKEALWRRLVVDSGECDFCEEGLKDTMHAMVNYPSARHTWDS